MNGIGSKSLGYLDDELAILIRLALRVAKMVSLVRKLDEWCICISRESLSQPCGHDETKRWIAYASVKTTNVVTPSFLQVAMTLQAISPRFAIRTLDILSLPFV